MCDYKLCTTRCGQSLSTDASPWPVHFSGSWFCRVRSWQDGGCKSCSSCVYSQAKHAIFIRQVWATVKHLTTSVLCFWHAADDQGMMSFCWMSFAASTVKQATPPGSDMLEAISHVDTLLADATPALSSEPKHGCHAHHKLTVEELGITCVSVNCRRLCADDFLSWLADSS